MPNVFGTGTAIGTGRTFAGGAFNYRWTTKTDLSVARYAGGADEIDGIVYFVGGYNASSTVQNRCDAYDFTTNSWTQKASMPATRAYPAVAVVNGKLYVMGGYVGNPGAALDTTFEYDPVANTWATKAVMPRIRASATAAVLDGKIYLFGGTTSSTTPDVSAIDVYNPATDTWTTKSSTMPTPRVLPEAEAGGDGFIYVGGGYTSGTTASALMHRYNPVADTWTSRTSMPVARYGHAFTRRSGLIYSSGGFVSSNFSTSHIAYDVATNTWSTKTAMGTGRYLLSASTCPAGIVAMGGYNGSGLATNEHFGAPELEGQATAIGRGQTIPYPAGQVAAVGVGVVVEAGEVEFSGRVMHLGPIRLNPVS